MTVADDISMNKNISFKMLQRVQEALEEEQSPSIDFDDDLISRAIQAGNLTRLRLQYTFGSAIFFKFGFWGQNSGRRIISNF